MGRDSVPSAGAIRLGHLRALLAVEQQASFSRAAEQLGTTQSTVSAQLAKLENALGFPLVDRHEGCLTSAGQVVARHARHVVAELHALDSDLANLRGEIDGLVRVGLIATTSQWLTPLLLDAAQRDYPAVKVNIEEDTSVALVDRLVDAHIDLAVIASSAVRSGVIFEPLFEEELIAAIPTSARAPSDHFVGLAELVEYPLILPVQNTAYRDELDRAARASNVTMRPIAEVDGVRLIAALVAEGHGAAVLPATAVRGWPDDLCYLRNIRDLPPRTIGVARPTTAASHAAIRAVQASIADLISKSLSSINGLLPRSAVAEGVGLPGPGRMTDHSGSDSVVVDGRFS
jgi:LysR family hydrogen peroxide-inducible transcriptional activator